MIRSLQIPGRIASAALSISTMAVLGCGSIVNEQDAQNDIHTQLESSLNIVIDNVDCPPDMKVEPKATFRCDVETLDGQPLVATVTIVNEDADLEIKAVSAR